MQNWIGGSDWHPLDADFVPPAPDRVPSLMEDLSAYLAGGIHFPIVQASLVHAQFETIHPFTDGNGRVDRSLIHTVFARRGLIPDAVLAVNLVLSALSSRYIGGLTALRHDAPPGPNAAVAAQASWIWLFADVTGLACDQAERIAAELAEVRADWDERLLRHRRDVAASRALDELREAGILETRSIGPSRQAFVATDVLDTITRAERRLASTRFDTRVQPPHPGVPAAPAERVHP